MRITDIRETSIALNSTLKNSSIDFSEMTTSVVAVITDVMRDGRPVVGYAFNSTGRYACGAQMRARFIPRILKADPKSLINGDARGFVKILSDPATGVVLGGAIVGRNAAELISVIAVAATSKLQVVDIVDSLLVHPALAESLAEAAY